ncbi:MAG: hypothetical protein KDD40_11600 [Bdellovibrionales bacterium]|nr:hypothetical protein [Bdellovibrionales bacterium]
MNYLTFFVLPFTFSLAESDLKKCFYVSSYHQGYAWSDSIEKELKNTLKDFCELKQFNMDTKRNTAEEFVKTSALKAKSIIEEWQPDILIISDDNAAKYLVQPYYLNSAMPIVFCGINWTAKEYGFPTKNITGIIEVAPIKKMLKHARKVSNGKRALYLGANTFTENKNSQYFKVTTQKMGIDLDISTVKTSEEWLNSYRSAQTNYDFIILGSNAGILDWDPDYIANEVTLNTKIFSTTSSSWMMPYSIYGLIKLPNEQGELAGKYVKKIISGTSPSELPIIKNKKWEIWINEPLLKKTHLNIKWLPKNNLQVVEGEEMYSYEHSAADYNSIFMAICGTLLLLFIFRLITK